MRRAAHIDRKKLSAHVFIMFAENCPDQHIVMRYTGFVDQMCAIAIAWDSTGLQMLVSTSQSAFGNPAGNWAIDLRIYMLHKRRKS